MTKQEFLNKHNTFCADLNREQYETDVDDLLETERQRCLEEFKKIYFDDAKVIRCAELILGK